MSDPTDAVDRITAQWRRERPDLDCTPMEVIGRITRVSALIQRELERVFALHGLTGGDFDVLATLRRSEGPLTPGELSHSTMVTTGGMTKLIDRAVEAHLGNEERLLADLPPAKREQLVALLRELLITLDR
jgi:DNA-binding MarR family transcriptional regulator